MTSDRESTGKIIIEILPFICVYNITINMKALNIYYKHNYEQIYLNPSIERPQTDGAIKFVDLFFLFLFYVSK